MNLTEVLERIKHPENILAVTELEDVIEWCTHWIYTLELDLADIDFAADTKLAGLVEVHGSVAKAEVHLKLTDIYMERKKKDITLKALKSYRQNIRRKRDRIIPR